MKAKKARIGQVIYWLEDCSGPESGPEPPKECWGPVIAIAHDGKPVVESHCYGEPVRLRRWSRIPKKHRRQVLRRDHRKRPRIVGGRRRR